MTEWALPPEAVAAYRRASRRLEATWLTPARSSGSSGPAASGATSRRSTPSATRCTPGCSASRGGSAALEAAGGADPDYLEVARQELYRGQCNCPYWHGSFGGLYLPHLRNAIYRSLIAADNALDDAEGRTGPRVALEVGDFNLDARQEVRLENDQLIALVRPAQGGHVYELDVRKRATNLLATLDRRPEAYHEAIREAAARLASGQRAGKRTDPNRSEPITLKQQGLDRPARLRPASAQGAGRPFLPGRRDPRRPGRLPRRRARRFRQRDLSVRRSSASRAGSRWSWSGRAGPTATRSGSARRSSSPPASRAWPSSYAPGRTAPPTCACTSPSRSTWPPWPATPPTAIIRDPAGIKLGMLDARLDLPHTSGLTLTDEWLDLSVGLGWSQAAGLWCFPIETVSQSEGGFEGVYQSSAVIPHWHVTADEHGRWEVRIHLNVDHVSTHCTVSTRESRVVVEPASRVTLNETPTASNLE